MMTLEEAIKTFEDILQLSPTLDETGCSVTEAMKVALSALRPVSREQLKRENNALWTYIEIVDREYRRYMDRGYIDRLDELKRTWKCGQKED